MGQLYNQLNHTGQEYITNFLKKILYHNVNLTILYNGNNDDIVANIYQEF